MRPIFNSLEMIYCLYKRGLINKGWLMAVDNALRLRQICLLAYDLEWISGVLSAAFDAPVV